MATRLCPKLLLTSRLLVNLILEIANGLYGRLIDAINFNQIVIQRLLGILDPFDDAYDFQPPIPLTLTPYGLLERVTGFSSYIDPAVQQLAANVVATVTNNRVTVQEDQKPADVATFYDGTKFVALEGDALLFRITFRATPNNFANIASQIGVWLDYGGGIRSFEQTKPLIGYNVTEPITYQVPVYIGPTFAANGAVLKVMPDGPVEISDVSYMVTRLHKGVNV